MNALSAATATSFAALPDSLLAELPAALLAELPAALLECASPTAGPLRLGSWNTTAIAGGRFEHEAVFGIGDTITRCAATTFGPIEALTTMLYELGVNIEILAFHQFRLEGETATFTRCERDGSREWSMAIDADPTLSSLRAVVAGANLPRSRPCRRGEALGHLDRLGPPDLGDRAS